MSASNMLRRISSAVTKFENSIESLLQQFLPPGPGFALAGVEQPFTKLPGICFPSAKKIWEDAILAAVPRNRRSIERRLTRRFGNPDYHYKMIFMKKNLQSCATCGNFHEPGLLCPHCYSKVIQETKEISDKIQETLKLEPIEKDVIVLYENDKVSPEFFEGKRIVEMEKPRPQWFSSNLMQPSTQEPDEDAKEVKPKDLA
ncbi:39S ribosomal protein L32, mitochondrial [Frankliniella occidentalis]|uniref:Large ribosomal subunit protein bL32m n=1 Tax=Frankliniella occidentalis TaxID=133901 RepID=A0A6J1TLE2_FRAOC|nr:39S ribosomal protein L32, mitochondrial [Frankliniella occidentalis]